MMEKQVRICCNNFCSCNKKRARTFVTSIQNKPTRGQLLRESTLREGGSQANMVEAGTIAAQRFLSMDQSASLGWTACCRRAVSLQKREVKVYQRCHSHSHIDLTIQIHCLTGGSSTQKQLPSAYAEEKKHPAPKHHHGHTLSN